ncbi:MAG: mechanosensitive ion channel family protein [Candidatus Margulisbacteria bacterium]|nr:mechanosensitive ion channel family protein [Candidatus Margulisiibacteriota bacterium]
MVFAVIGRFVAGTTNRLDDTLARESKLPFFLGLVIAGFSVIGNLVGLPPRLLPYVNRFSQLAVIFLLIYAVIRFLYNFLVFGGQKNSDLNKILPSFSRLANLAIWGAAILLALDLFGISITPVLASLGIAALALSLALQDTLANFFSGLYILVSRPIRMGDYVELENGLKGYVLAIGWRETRIRTLPNNTVVIPNNKLAQSIVINYYLPEKEMACLVQVGVSYGSDLEKVERVTCEVGKEVLSRVSGAVNAFDPFIRYHTFADFSVNFTVILRINEFVDQYLVTHEFIKALHKRYKAEGIEIPFPIRTVQMKNS